MHRSWNGLSRWADRRLPGLLLLAFLLLMSQLDPARATDIELAPTSTDADLSLAVLGFVCAAPLPAFAALLYGLRRARQSRVARESRAARPVNFPATERQDSRNTTECRTMRLGEFLAAALLLGGIVCLSLAIDRPCSHGLACRAEPSAAMVLFGRVGERLLASLAR
jgi:hypothetical protein